MPTIEPEIRTPKKAGKFGTSLCYHCGSACYRVHICREDKTFCCQGCLLVYELIHTHGLCNYYELQNHPGLRSIKTARREKYSFLDDETIARHLCSFSDGDYTIVTFYIPGVHCSSCMWLLEHLSHLNEGISESRLNFSTREVSIHFFKKKISLRQVAELLTAIGYEPYISLDDEADDKAGKPDRKRLLRLGVAGFCFSFIMMMSFPEYFGGAGFEHRYATTFRLLNLTLSLPVFFYCAGEFFSTAWSGLKTKRLNIDAPIALAIIITFSRSLVEIIGNTGAGYLDSMSGIVFFMLVGRIVQERTYRSLSFHRDYRSYFPIAVTLLGNDGPEVATLHDLKKGDVVQVYNEEIIPADSVLLSKSAYIDYSFVTGESNPMRISKGEQAYAGGRLIGESIQLVIQQPVAASYLTSLWNHQAFAKNKHQSDAADSSIHRLSKHFTVILFSLVCITAGYWLVHDSSRVWNSATAMLIVACPCALLLSSTFTNGNLLRIFSNSGLFLRDAQVIEQLGKIDHIVFDKTGTLTQGTQVTLCSEENMNDEDRDLLYAVVKSSRHPLSKALARYSISDNVYRPGYWREFAGLGIEAIVEGNPVKVGSALFTDLCHEQANVYARIGDHHYSFNVSPQLRSHVPVMMDQLRKHYQLSLLSGDHARQQLLMRELLGSRSTLLFEQKPVDKLAFIERMQAHKHRVLMIGDGLNDAGALQQSNVGITLADDVNNFTPACDAILDAKRFEQLPALLRLAKAGRVIIHSSFAISILYNLCGLFFAVQGQLNPMIAAILMPASTLTIVLLSTGISAATAKLLGLSSKT